MLIVVVSLKWYTQEIPTISFRDIIEYVNDN